MTDTISSTISSPRTLLDLIQPTAIAHLDHALELLAADGPLNAAAIHEIRRSVKRIRALLQLVRSDLKSRFAAWDKLLRSVNLALSGARDLEVCLQNLRELSAGAARPQRDVLSQFSTELIRRQSVLISADSVELRPELSARLETVKAGVLEWKPRRSGFALIKPALRKMAKQARQLIQGLSDQTTSEDLHSLRKVVKRRLYWLEAFHPIWPRGLGAERKLVDSLSDRLGKHHDLAVLIEGLIHSEVASEESSQPSVKRVVQRLKRRQHKLELHSLRLARRLFVERPSAMTRRWHGLVEIWQKSTPATTYILTTGPNGEGLDLIHGESA